MQWKVDPTNARIAQLATDVATLNNNFDPAVPINKGGTGATTAANARTNLGLGGAATNAIANNLTTTASGSVLDARQGKVLNDKIVDLEAFTFTTIGSNEDLNDFQKAGFYGCSSSSLAQTLTNCPTTSNFFMIVANKHPAYQTQIIFTGQYFYVRTESSSGWGVWWEFTGTNVS